MKFSVCGATILIIFLLLSRIASSRHLKKTPRYDNIYESDAMPSTMRRGAKADFNWERRPAMKRRGPNTLQVAGSSLPDCSHACGSCFPCKLVTVSFVCATLEEAETCPMAYKCMCKNKSYPIP